MYEQLKPKSREAVKGRVWCTRVGLRIKQQQSYTCSSSVLPGRERNVCTKELANRAEHPFPLAPFAPSNKTLDLGRDLELIRF